MMYNSSTMAYIGDSVYETYIRNYLINTGIMKVDLLQKEAVKYVSARGQALYLQKLINLSFFTESELEIIKRGRNHKSKSHPKNTDIVTYKHATGFEALIGFLYLNENHSRIEEIITKITEEL